ncbi:hypothetical protein AGABI1DRAFT_108019 [Agaricus bisporus var. burnettii JB137-S8]|uniref:AB hydrolase-1 domain-containing protein n=1 Tax=Agaricus bisporus var. burnettii (strain JB137-S8 / ATCC MYA-4627 / FGSC 10392) TaxID=597362 RepID=K5VSQ4_AGABU|nr:uncharacterized protein AGABI1DRAFT_108019 [Agaricus bisporus var. burnettii JB137-S8]EKM77489.1 hypothetical protein AGABI1DRAFT_108019 [Agaricus bisporus var. burnettii JB137-S8]
MTSDQFLPLIVIGKSSFSIVRITGKTEPTTQQQPLVVKKMENITASEEGKIDFTYGNDKFQTYYKAFGDVRDRSKRPLIVLHGGPGFIHDYLVIHSDLSSKYGIPVILYDQLGNGRSTHLKEKPSEFWTFELFIAELENVIDYFGIRDGFDILGHSWGGILASEFEVRKQPKGLKHLILGNSLAAHSLWKESSMQFLEAFPDDVKEGMTGGLKEPQKFFEAFKKLHAVHGCTVKPFPSALMRTFEAAFGPDGDPTVVSSQLVKDWSIIDRLHLVRPPTFVINGRKDLSQDFVVKPFFEKIQKSGLSPARNITSLSANPESASRVVGQRRRYHAKKSPSTHVSSNPAVHRVNYAPQSVEHDYSGAIAKMRKVQSVLL